MAYDGSIELIAGLKQANNLDFPLVDASAVRIDDNTRLDDFVENLEEISQAADAVQNLIENFGFENPEESYVLVEFNPERTVRKKLWLSSTDSQSWTIENLHTYDSGNINHAYAIYKVSGGLTYYVSGSTPANTERHPLLGYYASTGPIISVDGTDGSTAYTDYETTAPTNAEYMVVNKYSSQPAIAVKKKITLTGIKGIDDLNVSLMNLEKAVDDIKLTINNSNNVIEGATLTPDNVVEGLYNINNGEVRTGDSRYQHAIYVVEENKKYFITGGSAASSSMYPLCAFYDENDDLIDAFGNTASTTYTDYLVTSPLNSVKLVVNRAYNRDSIIVKEGKVVTNQEGTAVVATAKSYNLDAADALIRQEKKNPFAWKEFDKGYVTFIFDDLCTDLDSVASLFEQYNYPLVVAAIPSHLGVTANALTATRGSFTPGMLMSDVVNQIVTNGGEVMVHNSAPVVTAENQYDYDFMYSYFCNSKQALQAYGYNPRGIIRAGGTGAINRSDEITRWLIGNYEYANMGTQFSQYTWDRTTIQQSQANLKTAILNAKQNNTWLRFMCHSYTFGNGETFTGESDLIELLEYCQEIGIDVVTVGYVFDHYGSNALKEQVNSIDGDTSGGTSTYAVDTLLANSWVNNSYDLGYSGYNLTISLAPNATLQQAMMYQSACIVGSQNNNTIKALGIIPSDDIPILIMAKEV